MIKIKNKIESLKYIKKLNLNHFGEMHFVKNDLIGVNKFLKKYDVHYYFLRELVPSTENVFYNLSKGEVLEKIKDYDNFGLDVSSLNYIDNLVLCGEIIIGKENSFIFSGSTNSKSTHRNFLKPNYFFNTDIFDKEIYKIPAIKKIIDYIFNHNIFDVIIEFCIFDISVGINKEEVVIYELRTDY